MTVIYSNVMLWQSKQFLAIVYCLILNSELVFEPYFHFFYEFTGIPFVFVVITLSASFDGYGTDRRFVLTIP